MREQIILIHKEEAYVTYYIHQAEVSAPPTLKGAQICICPGFSSVCKEKHTQKGKQFLFASN